jgi:transposase-like protein
MDKMHTKNDEKIESDDKYKCEECGINFGNSIGYMERHKLTVHLQRARYGDRMNSSDRLHPDERASIL